MNAEVKNNTIPEAYSGGLNYVVISYWHGAAEEVVSDIEQLTSQGIHVWYDEGLVYGELWNEQVLQLIASDKCVGVVFYVSEGYMARDTFWQEAEMAKKNNKSFCVVMIAPQQDVLRLHSAAISEKDMYERCQSLIVETFEKLGGADGGKMSGDTLTMLQKMFHKDRLYINYSDDKRFKIMNRCFKRWGINIEMVKFPLCNVIHNGHIEYLPSLLAVTPFNYTFLLVSLRQPDLASLLNESGKQPIQWKQYSRIEFLNKDSFDTGCDGLAVCLSEENLGYVCQILEKRANLTPRSPLLINIWSDDYNRFDSVIERIKEIVRQWKYIAKDALAGIDDYFLCQTESSASFSIESDVKIILGLEGNEKWRILLSERAYFDELLKHTKDKYHIQEAKWLFSQTPIMGDNCFDDERIQLNSANELIEVYNRDYFRTIKYDWEG